MGDKLKSVSLLGVSLLGIKIKHDPCLLTSKSRAYLDREDENYANALHFFYQFTMENKQTLLK